MFFTGLYPTTPLYYTPNLIFSPPPSSSSFKTEATSAEKNILNNLSRQNYKYPERKLISKHPIKNGFHNLSHESTENVIIESFECINVLNLINKNGNSNCCSSVCRQVHGRVVKLGALISDSVVGNKLVVCYAAKAGFLDDARKLFDEIPKREVSGFSALIGGLCKVGKWVDVFSVLRMMVNDGMLPDRFLVPRILKACSAMEVGRIGKMVHGFVLRRGMEKHVFLGSALIDMYANCGDLRLSRTVFNTMSERTVASWNALIAAYMDHGLIDEAVSMFRTMELGGEQGDLISWNTLSFGFAHNGEIELALGTVEEMQQKGLKAYVNTWNGIISGCCHNGYYEDAIDSYVKMFSSSLTPNTVTVVSILPACSGLEDLELGQVIHGHAIKFGLCGNTHIDESLIGMYRKCHRIDSAESIFCRLKKKNSVICNEMIAAYMSEGNVEAALELFHSMKTGGPKPDEITYNTILAAYMSEGNVEAALELFYSMKTGGPKPDEITYNTILAAFIRDDKKSETYELLSEMLETGLHPNVVTLNIIISGYQQSGHNTEALSFLKAMQSPNSGCVKSLLMRKSIQPNSVTVASALAACADLGSLGHGKELHGYVLRNGLESSCFVSGAMVDMYSKCYEIDSATEVFRRTKDKNTVMWNTLIAGYTNTRGAFEAFGLFHRMLEERFEPSSVTFNILLSACGEVGALRLGREIHAYLLKGRLDDSSKLFLTSALIDMYAKCSSIREAKWVFDLATFQDKAICNAMISSFSAHGMTKNAFTLFEQMETSGIVPDGKTFTALLSACARDGLISEGQKYITLMTTNFGIIPSLEHYTCMVALMGTVGLLDVALELIRKMPFNPDARIWFTLLRSCKTHINPAIGEQAARALVELEPENPSSYILLSNIYACSGLWDASKVLRKFVNNMKSLKVECSYISIGSTLHSFKRGRVFSPLLDITMDTWHKLAEEMKIAGHSVQNPILGSEDDLDPFSCSHTEKLAISLGIVSSSNSQPIRVSKNVRMCFDCHTSAKLISKIVGREIFVKDVSFFHHMKNGNCSCQERW